MTKAAFSSLEVTDKCDDEDPTSLELTRIEVSTTDENTAHFGEVSMPSDTINVNDNVWSKVAGMAGNVLEWYDFAIFGSLSDILGIVFFPSTEDSSDHSNTVKSFAVFGGAFIMRPLGGLWIGYVGDKFGRKQALVTSIFLMAFPTFAMGCLPSYRRVGTISTLFLILVRLLQGLSVGGQLMSSLVYTIEQYPRRYWGWYGSWVMASANFGSLLGSIVGFVMRATLSKDDLVNWGWRIPFLSGILVSFAGCYLQRNGMNHGDIHGRLHRIDTTAMNPTAMACKSENMRSLFAAMLVPMLWSGGFYLTFVWMAVFMSELVEDYSAPYAFGITVISMFLSLCFFFPFAGYLSDRYGRRRIMTIGGVGNSVLGPIAIRVIAFQSHVWWLPLASQISLGIFLSFWGAPMCAWLVEGFSPIARLSSVAIGYNIAQLLSGASAPAVATMLVSHFGAAAPGWLYTLFSSLSLLGLWCVTEPSSVEVHDPVGTIIATPYSQGVFTAIPKSDVDA